MSGVFRAPARFVEWWIKKSRQNPNWAIYQALLFVAVFYPGIVQTLTGGDGGALVGLAADAGVYVLLALGLNVVVGFAGLLDLGYAAFFAIGAYTYGMLASSQLVSSPLHHAFHIPFWFLLFIALGAAALFGIILGAPTLRLRGDYLAIVTLGFGEIVPLVFRNLSSFTGGVNGIAALDQPSLPFWFQGPWINLPFSVVNDFNFAFDPTAFYVVIFLLVILVVLVVTNLQRSRLGRAWMAIREDETAAAAMGINTVNVKLMAFSIGASFSGFAGAYYAAKLSLVSPENFAFIVSVSILVMVVLGGMGNPPGVIIGAVLIYGVLYYALPNLPGIVSDQANNLGLGFLNKSAGDWPGLHDEVQRLNFLVYGLILVLIMLLRPQGLLPSRVRKAELKEGVADSGLGAPPGSE
jgi:ABC-type branched-subunit amino acid transport system permease subunit